MEEGKTMENFIIVNLESMEETTEKAVTLSSVYASHKGENIRVYPENISLCALYVAHKIAEKTLERDASETQKSIEKALATVKGKTACYLSIIDSEKQTGKTLDEYIASAIANCYHHAQDYFQVACVGLLDRKETYFETVTSAMKTVNRYIDSLRTQNAKEVLTAYDIETDEKVNVELRKMIVGLTEKETETGKTAKNSELASAIIATAKDCTPTQKKVMYLFGKGLSNHKVAEKMNVSRQAIIKHRNYIGKKLLKHDCVWNYVTASTTEK